MREKTYFSLSRYFGIGDGKESQIVQVPVRIGVDTIPDELECYLCATGEPGQLDSGYHWIRMPPFDASEGRC